MSVDITDWDIFRTSTSNLDDYAKAVTSYIIFCEGGCIPSYTRVCYNEGKPWFSSKKPAFRRGDRSTLQQGRKRS